MSAIKNACESVGGASRLAAILDVTPQAVAKWVAADRAPAERCLDIERASGVMRYQLRPDVFGTEPSEEKGRAPRSLRGTGTNRRSPSDRRDVIKAA